MIVNKQCDA